VLAARAEYRRIDLGTPGGMGTHVGGITNSGEVLGVFRTDYYTLHVFSWSRQEGFVDIDTFTGYSLGVVDVSTSGHVVGSGHLGLGGRNIAFICSRQGGLIIIASPGAPSCAWAEAVNNAGRVVGGASCPGPPPPLHAFSWTESGGAVDLGTLGGSYSRATEVSDAGGIIGWSSLPGDEQFHAFSWTSREGMIDLGTLGGSDSYAWAVSNRGHVVGEAETAGDTVARRAFLWTAQGGMIDLGTLGGPNSYATGVSDSGAVIGVAETPESAQHAFFWTPQTGMVDIGTGAPVAINQAGIVIGPNYAWSQRMGLVALDGTPVAINSRGEIVGYSGDHVVVWEPAASPQQ
jgi:probable HAF family extracellular repeat protein